MNTSQRRGVNGKASEKVGEMQAEIRSGNSGDGDIEGIILYNFYQDGGERLA